MSAIQERGPHLRFQVFFFSAGAFQQAQDLLAERWGRPCLSVESVHGKSCPAHLLALLRSVAHPEISSILHSVRARHVQAHIDDLSNIA